MYYHRHIIVCADDDITRTSLTVILKRAGFDVSIIPPAKDPLVQILVHSGNGNSPQCLLLELKHTRPGTMRLVEELKCRKVSFPILAITGYEDVEPVFNFLIREKLDYLSKPFGPGDLIEKLNLMLSRCEAGSLPVHPAECG